MLFVLLPPAGVFLVPARKTRKNRLGGSDPTAAGGGNREDEMAQRSKSTVRNDQVSILGTARGGEAEDAGSSSLFTPTIRVAAEAVTLFFCKKNPPR